MIALACLVAFVVGLTSERSSSYIVSRRVRCRQKEREQEVLAIRLALAIDADWQSYGCARPLTIEEIEELQNRLLGLVGPA